MSHDDINDYISMLPSSSQSSPPHTVTTRSTTPDLDRELTMAAANHNMLIDSSGPGSSYNKRPKHNNNISSAKKRSNN